VVGALRRPASVLSHARSEETNGEARPRRRWIGPMGRNERALQHRRSGPTDRAAPSRRKRHSQTTASSPHPT